MPATTHVCTSRTCQFALTHAGACYYTLTVAQQAHLVRLGAALAAWQASNPHAPSALAATVARNMAAVYTYYLPGNSTAPTTTCTTVAA